MIENLLVLFNPYLLYKKMIQVNPGFHGYARTGFTTIVYSDPKLYQFTRIIDQYAERACRLSCNSYLFAVEKKCLKHST